MVPNITKLYKPDMTPQKNNNPLKNIDKYNIFRRQFIDK